MHGQKTLNVKFYTNHYLHNNIKGFDVILTVHRR